MTDSKPFTPAQQRILMRLNNELLMMQEEFNNYIVYLRFVHDASRDDYTLRDINVGFELAPDLVQAVTTDVPPEA